MNVTEALEALEREHQGQQVRLGAGLLPCPQAISSAPGLNRTSSIAVTIRRNRGYAVRSIDAMAPSRSVAYSRANAIKTGAELGLLDIDEWSMWPLRKRANFEGELDVCVRHVPYPGDYRTRAQIEAAGLV